MIFSHPFHPTWNPGSSPHANPKLSGKYRNQRAVKEVREYEMQENRTEVEWKSTSHLQWDGGHTCSLASLHDFIIQCANLVSTTSFWALKWETCVYTSCQTIRKQEQASRITYDERDVVRLHKGDPVQEELVERFVGLRINFIQFSQYTHCESSWFM